MSSLTTASSLTPTLSRDIIQLDRKGTAMDTGAQEVSTLQEFPPSTRGYERLADGGNDTHSFSPEFRQAVTTLAGLSPEQLHQVRQNTAQEIIINQIYSNTEPFYTLSQVATPDGQVQNRPALNQDVAPWAYHYEIISGVEPAEGARLYKSAEALTDNDSGLFGLCAVAASTATERARLYDTVAGAICQATQDLDALDLQSRIKQVFCTQSLNDPSKLVLPAASTFQNNHGRTDLLPGYVYNQQTGQDQAVVDSQIGNWATLWKERAQDAARKIAQGEKLSLADIKNVEFISHMFRPDEILFGVVDQVQKVQGQVEAPNPPDVMHDESSEPAPASTTQQTQVEQALEDTNWLTELQSRYPNPVDQALTLLAEGINSSIPDPETKLLMLVDLQELKRFHTHSQLPALQNDLLKNSGLSLEQLRTQPEVEVPLLTLQITQRELRRLQRELVMRALKVQDQNINNWEISTWQGSFGESYTDRSTPTGIPGVTLTIGDRGGYSIKFSQGLSRKIIVGE